MHTFIDTYDEKLCKNGLVAQGEALWGSRCADGISWNRPTASSDKLAPLFDRLPVSVLLTATPAEPYRTAIAFLARTSGAVICPRDSETRLFLGDLPVVDALDADALTGVLQHRRAVIVRDGRIVTCGPASAEQAYVTFSSVCFAGFVKFFSDLLAAAKSETFDFAMQTAMQQARRHCQPPPSFSNDLTRGPFDTETGVHSAIIEAGAALVEKRLVDSCFGNISYLLNDAVHISESGSFLDHLTDAIVACAKDAPPDACPGASSELPAHQEIFRCSDYRAIVHGHPVFAVIMSMDCDIADCRHRGQCHRYCPHYRSVEGVPVVSGEVGGGAYGLCTTVPKMIRDQQGAIVYGHGVFTGGKTDFNAAMAQLVAIERRCRRAYFNQIEKQTG